MRRLLIFVSLLLPSPLALAQAGSWNDVQALPTTTLVRVHGRHSSGKTCEFIKADDIQLICNQRRYIFFFPENERIYVPKAEVESVRRSRLGWSGVAGTLLGAGVGAAIGAALDSSAGVQTNHFFLYLLALLGAQVGGSVGLRTDFVHGTVVYQAP